MEDLMEFYEKLSEVYEYVFPVKSESIDFLKERILPNGTVLDVACGLGDHIKLLRDRGFYVEGHDFSSTMVKRASVRHPKLHFKTANMLELNQNIDDKKNAIICIGNSLVHLEDNNAVQAFIQQSFDNLEKNGSLIVQIVNYDRVLKNNVSSLPTINNQNIQFVRNYSLEPGRKKVSFSTDLTVNNETFKSEVKLLCLLKSDLEKMLKKAGFKQIEFYSDFKSSEWNQDGFATIFRAKKIQV